MFRSKWAQASVGDLGDQVMPLDSIYRVVKPPPQRRGELPPFVPNQMTGRGGTLPTRVLSGNTDTSRSSSFGTFERQKSDDGGSRAPKQPLLPVHMGGGFQEQHHHVFFCAFRPGAESQHSPFLGAPNYENSEKLRTVPERKPMLKENAREMDASMDASVQSRLPIEEALDDVREQPRALVHEADSGHEGINPKVSLPKNPVTTRAQKVEQKPPKEILDKELSVALVEHETPSLSPVKVNRKLKRHTRNKTAEGLVAPEVVSSAPGSASSKSGALLSPAVLSPIPLPPSVIIAGTAADGAAVPTGPKTNKQGSPALFTADQIKSRKQAWNRIAVPLSPSKSSLGSMTGNLLPARPAALLPEGNAILKEAINVTKELSAVKPIGEVKLGSDAGPVVGSQQACGAMPVPSPKKGGRSAKKSKKSKQNTKEGELVKTEYTC